MDQVSQDEATLCVMSKQHNENRHPVTTTGVAKDRHKRSAYEVKQPVTKRMYDQDTVVPWLLATLSPQHTLV